MTDREQRSIEYRGSGFYVSVLLLVILGIILLVFALQNTADVIVTLLGAEVEVPLFGVAIGAGLVTLIIDQLVGLVWRRQRRQRLEDRSELARLRAETSAIEEVEPVDGHDEEPVDGHDEIAYSPERDRA